MKSVLSLLERKEKVQLLFLIAGSILLGIIEVLGVSSIMPFIAVASQPELIRTNEYLAAIYSALNFSSDRSFLVALGILMLAFIIYP